MPNCAARIRASSASGAELRFEAQGMMTPSGLSQAALQRMDTRVQSLPPELPYTIPSAWASATSFWMKATRLSNSAL